MGTKRAVFDGKGQELIQSLTHLARHVECCESKDGKTVEEHHFLNSPARTYLDRYCKCLSSKLMDH